MAKATTISDLKRQARVREDKLADALVRAEVAEDRIVEMEAMTPEAPAPGIELAWRANHSFHACVAGDQARWEQGRDPIDALRKLRVAHPDLKGPVVFVESLR